MCNQVRRGGDGHDGTDILSEVLKGIEKSVGKRAEIYLTSFGVLATAAISVMAVVQGFQRRQEEARIVGFLAGLAALEALTSDAGAAVLAGRIYGELIG